MSASEKIIDVEIDGVKRETPKAYCVVIGKRESWLPKSLCELSDDKQSIAMPEWLAMDKALI